MKAVLLLVGLIFISGVFADEEVLQDQLEERKTNPSLPYYDPSSTFLCHSAHAFEIHCITKEQYCLKKQYVKHPESRRDEHDIFDIQHVCLFKSEHQTCQDWVPEGSYTCTCSFLDHNPDHQLVSCMENLDEKLDNNGDNDKSSDDDDDDNKEKKEKEEDEKSKNNNDDDDDDDDDTDGEQLINSSLVFEEIQQ